MPAPTAARLATGFPRPGRGRPHAAACALGLLLLALGGCGEMATLSVADGTGPRPTLPAPTSRLIPTVNIAPAVGWPPGATPELAPGTRVNAFAAGLAHPRWLLVLPNGDVLVAETNAPPKPDDATGIKGWIMGLVMARAGAAVPSANRITLLRDTDGDGVADRRSAFLEGLHSPFGMALVGSTLYVANSDAVLAFPYATGDLRSGAHRLFATGLRNPNGMAWEPTTGALWTVVNERDELGSDLVPDYLTSVRDGGFYGWPYSYFGQHIDARVTPQQPELVAKALVPDYALGPHTASLGLASSTGTTLPPPFAHGMFIGQHGSWNRQPHSGYQVVFVPFARGQPAGPPVALLTGFLSAQGSAYGRPVGVALDRQGALLVADDVGNVIWRVSATRPASAP